MSQESLFHTATDLQSQSLNRASLPGPDVYADLIGQADVDEFMQKHLGDRSSMIATYNDSSKHRAQYYEEKFQHRENGTSSVRERVQRESPVVAELRTNVIVCVPSGAIGVTTLTEHRSKMNSPLSRTSLTTWQHDTPGQIHV